MTNEFMLYVIFIPFLFISISGNACLACLYFYMVNVARIANERLSASIKATRVINNHVQNLEQANDVLRARCAKLEENQRKAADMIQIPRIPT